jgi:uncharacterized protein (TIGR02569 family)
VNSSPGLPPQHVCAAFGVRREELEPLTGGGSLWRADRLVLKPVGDTAEAAWIAQTLDTLEVDTVRLARPLRSSDGRWVVGGWTAVRHLAGSTQPRHDEMVAVSLRLHQATALLPRPRFLAHRTHRHAVADRVAWGEANRDAGSALFDEFSARRRPVGLRSQVVHGDLFGDVLFAGAAPPAVIGFSPYWRPPEWAAAVIVVDALTWGGADAGLVDRWAHLAEWPQSLLRALLFRLAAHALHARSAMAPAATERSEPSDVEPLAALERAAAAVRAFL